MINVEKRKAQATTSIKSIDYSPSQQNALKPKKRKRDSKFSSLTCVPLNKIKKRIKRDLTTSSSLKCTDDSLWTNDAAARDCKQHGHVISIDLGSKNLGYCDLVFIPNQGFKVLRWEVITLCDGKATTLQATECLIRELNRRVKDQIIDFSTLRQILIEEQPPINTKTFGMSYAMYGWFHSHCNLVPSSTLIRLHSTQKSNEVKAVSNPCSNPSNFSSLSGGEITRGQKKSTTQTHTHTNDDDNQNGSALGPRPATVSTHLDPEESATNATTNGMDMISHQVKAIQFVNSNCKINFSLKIGAKVDKDYTDNHRYNKVLAINAVTLLLQHLGEIRLLHWFKKQKKRDDLADCLLQALAVYQMENPNEPMSLPTFVSDKVITKTQQARRAVQKKRNQPIGLLTVER